MKEITETRDLFMLDGPGGIVPGTYHKTYRDSFCTPSSSIERDRVGVLFLNSLSPTRAANGDAAVYLADSFAEGGYPSFRLDLPGFGDSGDDPPAELFSIVNQGGYAPVTAAKISELVARFSLSGVIILGHCAGAVSAIYTAAVSRECRGLVLMGPYFHLPQTARPQFRRQLSSWAMRTRLGGVFSNIYDFLKKIRLLLRGKVPPENANFQLLRCWKSVASTGLPILILRGPARKASGVKPRLGEFDYLKYVLDLAGRKSHVIVKVTDGADHSFANRAGRLAVRQHTEQWLADCFPLTKIKYSDAETVLPEFVTSENLYEKPRALPESVVISRKVESQHE